MIADLHSHPTRRVYESDSLHTPVQEPDVKPALKSEDAQIHFAFLSPAEKGFFQGVQGGTLTQSTMQQFCECLARRDNTQIKKWITDHALASSRSGINKFDWLNALSDQISQPAVDYVKCGQYDYFGTDPARARHPVSSAPAGHPGVRYGAGGVPGQRR